MKKTIQVLIGIAALNGAGLVQSCEEKCGGSSIKPSYIDINGIRTAHDYPVHEYPYKGDSVVAAHYMLVILPDVTFFTLAKSEQVWGNTALACDPAILTGTLGSKEWISGITVKSNAAWDAQHAPGAPLNNIMEVRGTDFASPTYWRYMPVDSLAKEHPKAVRSIELRFTMPPTADKTHVFSVIYEQTNGERYTDTLKSITFQ